MGYYLRFFLWVVGMALAGFAGAGIPGAVMFLAVCYSVWCEAGGPYDGDDSP